jgi:hypothetical protein
MFLAQGRRGARGGLHSALGSRPSGRGIDREKTDQRFETARALNPRARTGGDHISLVTLLQMIDWLANIAR